MLAGAAVVSPVGAILSSPPIGGKAPWPGGSNRSTDLFNLVSWNWCANAEFRCQDKKGSFTAETTAWEGTAAVTAPGKPEGLQEGQAAHVLKAAPQGATKSNKSG